MKTKDLLGILLLFFCAHALASCSDNEEEGRKVTGYKEYTVTVASKKVPGVVFSCGNDIQTEVYAVKKEKSGQWEQMSGIIGFDYETGYEYRIRISETNYLDYRMGEPAWTEYHLLEQLSKEQKASEGLPETFVPEYH